MQHDKRVEHLAVGETDRVHLLFLVQLPEVDGAVVPGVWWSRVKRPGGGRRLWAHTRAGVAPVSLPASTRWGAHLSGPEGTPEQSGQASGAVGGRVGCCEHAGVR